MSGRLISTPREMKKEYKIIVIGSGYGGAITAARLAEAGHQVSILERGKEWVRGKFPDSLKQLAQNVRRPRNPLGLYEYLPYDEIDVLKSCGLGGTSLINANVAIRPDKELFQDKRWPKPIRDLATSGKIWNYYKKAETMLRANPHPYALDLKKVQAMKKRRNKLKDARFTPLNIVVNFDVDGPNHVGVEQRPCIDCGDCVTGCNVKSKNTLDTNYLPYAKQKGAKIFTQIEVSHIKKGSDGSYTIYYRRNENKGQSDIKELKAMNIVLAAGSLGSTEILLRSKRQGLRASNRLGSSFSGNADFFGIAYNNDQITDVLGFGNYPDDQQAVVKAGPSIVSTIQYDRSKPFKKRITVQDLSFPRGLVDIARKAFPKLALLIGKDTDFGFVDKIKETQRIGMDFLGRNPKGALNSSMLYLVMGIDDSKGRMLLNKKDKLEINWKGVPDQPIFNDMNKELLEHAKTLGGTFIENFRWTFLAGRNLVTAHPLGGCSLGRDADNGVVDEMGRVFDGRGNIHKGLYVVDGAILPMALGVNPFLTISALAERIAEQMPPTLAT